MLEEGHIGVHPPGALGVGFFTHAGAECFIGRCDDGITEPLKKAGSLNLLDKGKLRSVPLKGRILSNLLEADARGCMPELLFVCCNPNQLGLFTAEMTRFLENLSERGHLQCLEDVRQRVPILLILPNGILSEQTVETYGEQLHESMLMRRLPGVSEEMISAVLDRIVRGVSLQAGGRRGEGKDTVYLLEKKGSLVFAGGGELERRRIESVLSAHAYPFKHIEGVPGTRIEFDKAMISIVLNVGGLIHTVKHDGDLIDLRMGDLCKDPSKAEFIERITRTVFDVGQACGAYPSDASYQEIWAGHKAIIMSFAGHVTSSLKYFHDALAAGLNSVKLFPNEEWILTPLARYAARSGLTAEESLFGALRRQIQESMARAIRYRDVSASKHGSGTKTMKLIAQRNIGIELYESDPEEMTLVGTMLDSEHLIKLEMTIFLPDEQITRSKLDMIRAPFPVCREVEMVAERLVGLRIERGVLTEISSRIGGRVGCSHIKELATSMVYFVASSLVRRRVGVDPMNTAYTLKPPDERFGLTKELLRDSCLAYCQTTPQGLDEEMGIKRVGEIHTHPLALGDFAPSLGVLLRERADRLSEKVYLRYRKGDRDYAITWSEFSETASRIARHLMEQGIRTGDRIGMISENRAEMFLFEMAVMSMGAVSVPIFAGYLQPQIDYVLGHARPRFVVVSGKHQLDKIEKGKHPWVERYYCMDFDATCAEWGAHEFDELTKEGGISSDRLKKRIDSVRPDDLCMIMYTSGTTGPPKGVRLAHRHLISQQKAISLIWDVSENDVLMGYLPWHHSFGGLFERFVTLYSGCELCLDDSRGRDIDRMIENWKAFRPTLFFSVPRVHDLIVAQCRQNADIAKLVLGDRLRFVFTAGASLPAHIEAAYHEHNIPVLEGWGLTETSPCVTITTTDSGWQSGYVGFPIPGVTIRIDSDQEILVRGPNVMDGYLDDEEATAHVIDENGWFRSGDLGEFTRDGLRIFGRKDGAFKLTTGEKVHPLRIENVLVNESPYVSQTVVLGSGRDFVAALIYPDFARLREWAAEHDIAEEGLLENTGVRELFATELERINPLIDVKYQRIRRAVLADREPSLANGELTPSGKLVRKTALNNYRRKIDDLFSAAVSPHVLSLQPLSLQRT